MENTLNYINTSIQNLQPLAAIGDKQTAACQYYNAHGMAFGKDEVWRFVDFSSFLNDNLDLPQSNETHDYEFTCNIPNLDTTRLTLFNGYVSAHDKMTVTEQGVIMGSIKEALKIYPELVAKYFGNCYKKDNSFLASNTALFTDGFFIYVPDNVFIERPIQILDVIKSQTPLFLQTRNLIYVGKNSRITFIHCDDSYNQNRSFSNNVTEIFIDRDAHVEHYKMQNMNNNSGLMNHNYIAMEQGASLLSNSISLNGGNIRNHNEVRMLGEHCDTQMHGLYLMDKEQRIDNYVYVEHAFPNCTSNELFKGILDDSAHATFNGHVLVYEHATKTDASQANKNILLTDKAKVDSKPFLEIYNDDVKCSHGSTIGQLDETALFYIRSRGISERTAKTLLMYAFCDEVIQKIAIPALAERLSDMVKKRLHGELTVCDECALHCSVPECKFEIDVTKL